MTKTSTIWVIDDDRSIRWVLEKAMKQAGMEVECFDNASGILALLERRQPDAILTDIRMPGINGLELLNKLSEEHPGLPVIISQWESKFGCRGMLITRVVLYL